MRGRSRVATVHLSAEIQFAVRVGFSVCSQGIMNFSINVVGKIGGQVKADP